MTTKNDILKYVDDWGELTELEKTTLSGLIDSLIAGCPSETNINTGSMKYWDGYREHIKEIEQWKQEVLK